jgi:large subunit ribosomal protein L28
MTRQCQITGKIRQVGNKVSHANNKTKRRFNPNIRDARVYSETLKRFFSLKITAAGMRTIEHNGGLDAWLLKQTPSKLDTRLRKVREQLKEAGSAAK